MRILAILLAAGLPASQAMAAEPEADPRPTGIYFHYGLFFAPEPTADPMATAKAILAKSFAGRFTYKTDEVKLNEGAYVAFRSMSTEDYHLPEDSYLEQKGFGLTKTNRDQLRKGENVFIVDVFAVRPKNYDYLTAANELTAEIARETGGFVWDEETREIYDAAVWRQKRLPEDVPVALANTTVHSYELKSGHIRSVTLGMRKLGQPDIALLEYPRAFWNPVVKMMEFLVRGVAAPGPLQPKREWTPEELREAYPIHVSRKEVPGIRLVAAPPEEGDPRNDVWTVDFSAYPGEDYHQQQAYLIDRVFEPNDALLAVWAEREELMRLSDQARERLKEKKPLLEKGLQPNEQITVKAFKNNEYLWMLLTSWKEDTLGGMLITAPLATTEIKPGAAMEVTLDQVFDYMHLKPDGSREGDATGAFIRKLQQQREAAGKKEADL